MPGVTKSRGRILCSAREAASLQERSRGERKRSLGVSIPGRRKLVTAAERISPINGTEQDDLVTPVRATRIFKCAPLRLVRVNPVISFQPMLPLSRVTPLPSEAFRRRGGFHERKVFGWESIVTLHAVSRVTYASTILSRDVKWEEVFTFKHKGPGLRSLSKGSAYVTENWWSLPELSPILFNILYDYFAERGSVRAKIQRVSKRARRARSRGRLNCTVKDSAPSQWNLVLGQVCWKRSMLFIMTSSSKVSMDITSKSQRFFRPSFKSSIFTKISVHCDFWSGGHNNIIMNNILRF